MGGSKLLKGTKNIEVVENDFGKTRILVDSTNNLRSLQDETVIVGDDGADDGADDAPVGDDGADDGADDAPVGDDGADDGADDVEITLPADDESAAFNNRMSVLVA